MRGLILKDIAIVKTQMRSMMIIMAIVIFMMVTGDNASFAIMYCNILFMMFGVTTLSYDAFENGHAFLFTLPVTRKLYVKEKYVFSLICLLIGFLLSILVLGITAMKSQSFDLSMAVGYMFGGAIFLSIMLPIDFKFGPEKARVAMIVVVLFITSSVYAISAVVEKLNLVQYFGKLVELGTAVILSFLAVVTSGILFASYKISCRIICKKEF